MTRSTTTLAALALGLTSATTAIVAEVSVTLKPALFKMKKIGGGGAIPLTGPVITVPYDKTQKRYLAIREERLELPVILTTDCESGRVDEVSLKVAGTTIPVNAAGLGKSGHGFGGTKTITTNAVTTRALDNASVPNPVATCNADLDALVAANDHDKARKGWAREYANALPATLTLRCVGPSTKKGGFTEPGALTVREATTRFPVWVHCGDALVYPRPEVRKGRAGSGPAKPEPQRVKPEPQRVGSNPQRVGSDPKRVSPALPDLVINAAQPAPTAPTKLRVQIANKGTAAAAAAKLTLFYHRSGKIMKVVSDVPALDPGATQWIIVDAGSPLEYATHITLRVDDPSSVPELDEGNNAFTVK